MNLPKIITDRLEALKCAGVDANLNMAIENAVYALEMQHSDQLNGARAAAKMTLTNREQNIVNKVFSTSLSPREAAELLKEVFEMTDTIEWCTGYFNVLRHGMPVSTPVVKREIKARDTGLASRVQTILSSGPCTPKDIAAVLDCKIQQVYCIINQMRKSGVHISMIKGEYHVE